MQNTLKRKNSFDDSRSATVPIMEEIPKRDSAKSTHAEVKNDHLSEHPRITVAKDRVTKSPVSKKEIETHQLFEKAGFAPKIIEETDTAYSMEKCGEPFHLH